jgi:hypothetical protein
MSLAKLESCSARMQVVAKFGAEIELGAKHELTVKNAQQKQEQIFGECYPGFFVRISCNRMIDISML